jgi:hypothetical protein
MSNVRYINFYDIHQRMHHTVVSYIHFLSWAV